MKVIRETILDKILKEINKDKEDIIRIELTNLEFIKLLNTVIKESLYNDGKCAYIKIEENLPIKVDLTNHNIQVKGNDYSGSYIVLNGVCIQTHSSYTD